MRWNAHRALTSIGLLAPAAVAACSLINQYDALAPARASNDAAVQDANEPDVATADVQTSPDATADVVVQPNPSPGVIVIGGTASSDAGDVSVLTALDPRTGSEFTRARETLKVSAVEYDGVRDLWYVFESGGAGVYPLPGDPFFLHVRRIDRV